MTLAKTSQAAARLSRPALIVAVAICHRGHGLREHGSNPTRYRQGCGAGRHRGRRHRQPQPVVTTPCAVPPLAYRRAGAIAGNLWSKRMQEQQAAMEQATAGTPGRSHPHRDNQAQAERPSDISFDRNSATLKPELRSVLDTFAQGLTRNGSGMVVRIVGHTDSTGTDAINNPLSLQRAESVKNYLNDRGVPASRIETVGRGSREPIASNATRRWSGQEPPRGNLPARPGCSRKLTHGPSIGIFHERGRFRR